MFYQRPKILRSIFFDFSFFKILVFELFLIFFYREFKEAKKSYENIKNKVENDFERIKALRADRNQKEKLENLYQTIFW